MLLSTNSQSPEKISGEAGWKNQEFFYDERANFNLEKKDVPENTLCYVNQRYISTGKGSELAIYNHVFLLGQFTIAANQKRIKRILRPCIQPQRIKLQMPSSTHLLKNIFMKFWTKDDTMRNPLLCFIFFLRSPIKRRKYQSDSIHSLVIKKLVFDQIF